MGSRGQKRSELGDEFPADKRACSSLESRPSSSNSPPQTTVIAPKRENHEGDMETSSSSASASGRSEGDLERDHSPYGSCDSDDYNDGDIMHRTLARFQRQRSYGDQGKIKGVISTLTDDTDPSGQLVSLTELCEVLSFSTEDSMSGVLADQLAPVLVKFANHESNPDIMLLSIRAIAYLCDVYPRASAFLVRHDTVPALCQRLAVIEYLDVAEQCLQALEKISRDQPLACLQSGAIMAVLGFIDFFSTSIQRTALSTVVNICKKLPSECPVPFMEAVPTLCGLLNYEDRQLVESAVTCLVKIADRVKDSRDRLDELCKHGLVQQTMHLIGSNSRTTLSQTTFTSLIGLLAKLAAGSSNAVSTIFEHDVGSIVRNVLSNYELSHGIEKNGQVHEVLRLLNELLPPVVGHQESQPLSPNEKILADYPDELGKFGMNVLPILIQVVNSGANLYVCHGCLSVINKLVYQIKSDVLFEMVENTNMPSFLMGVFTRKDYHILTLALLITELLLEKLSDTLMPSFAKEGVLFAIDALLAPEKCSAFMFPSTSEMLPPDFSLKNCLCYTYGNGDCVSTSEPKACKLEKDCVQEVARRIREKYFAADLHSFESVVTDVLQNLRKSASKLTSLLSTMRNGGCTPLEEELCSLLHQVMAQIGADEPISTFELLESGIIKALVNFLFGGLHEEEKVGLSDVSANFNLVLKRFEAFARSAFSSSDPSLKDVPFSLLVRKLQIALSTAERFPVILGNLAKPRGSYASIPFGRPTAHPCLRVRLKREEDEKDLVDYPEDVATVDPFCSVSAIKSYLWPRVAKKGSDISKPSEGSDLSESVLQDERDKTAAASLASMDIDVSKSMAEPLAVLPDAELHHPVDGDVENEIIRKGTCFHYPSNGEAIKSDASSDVGNGFSRLGIFLEGIELDDSSTLYQSVLQQRMKSQDAICGGAKVWIEVYTLTYKKAALAGNESLHPTYLSNEAGVCQQHLPFSSNVVIPESLPDLETPSPAKDILFLLRNLEIINRYGSHLVHHETVNMFAVGKGDDFGLSKLMVPKLSSNDFVNSKLSQKLEQQMRDPLTVSVGAMPLWCKSLISTCPFLFTFEAKCKFFQLATFGRSYNEPQSPRGDSARRASSSSLLRKKFLASRECILDSAAQMMDKLAGQKVILEVEYNEEVGTGLGPTLEFYTLVCQEFQKTGLGMWRGDYRSFDHSESKMDLGCGVIATSMGLFPRPWSERTDTSSGSDLPDIVRRFSLLGWIVAKGLQDRRVLDIPFSKAFYKLILGQDLTLYDIQSFDPEFGRTLLEFHAIVGRQKFLESACEGDLTSELDLNFRGMKIEALCLDFALPGYPDYVFADKKDHSEVTIDNLEDYVTLVVDATLNAGIRKQVEAFKSGFNKVFPISHLQIFTEEELEHLLCGEHDSWVCTELLDHIKLDHGYTASSRPIVFLLEILRELNYEQRRAFLQFVTGAPRLPPGGLGALNPKLTIVRKHSSNSPDLDLPSVMTCTNYLKLPPYSSKELMKEKLVCAITEGQGSFHLS